jgi:hypothetical protein
MHARIDGPLVAELQAAFQSHWVKTYGEALSGADQFPALPPADDLKAQLVTSQSFSVAPIPLVQATAFAAAEKRIWIANAYCTLTDDQVELLVQAVKRHVDVRLMLPGANNDQPLTKSAGRAAYGRLLEGGVKIFEYQPTMIHEKAMVVDGMFVMFGSSNLDARSSEINEELDVVVYDENSAARWKLFSRKICNSVASIPCRNSRTVPGGNASPNGSCSPSGHNFSTTAVASCPWQYPSYLLLLLLPPAPARARARARRGLSSTNRSQQLGGLLSRDLRSLSGRLRGNPRRKRCYLNLMLARRSVNLPDSSEPLRLEPVRQAHQGRPERTMHIRYLATG